MNNLVHWRQGSEFLGFVSLLVGDMHLIDSTLCTAEEWLTGDMGL